MSKECCGIIHSEEETICSVCGKPFVQEDSLDNNNENSDSYIEEDNIEYDNTELEEQDNLIEEQDYHDNEEEQDEKSYRSYNDKATPGLKTMGIISLVMAVLGLAMVGLFTYFLVISPNYDKSGEISGEVNYPAIASYNDGELQTTMEPLISTMSDATATDASATDADSDIE